MACEIRIIDFNYTTLDNVDITSSSEHVSFPSTNIGHEFRSKVWRSTGYFVIDATNNKIDFKETSLGPEITATLAVGNYSTSDLITEIESKMTAASLNARTYSVTHSNTTGKWTIAGSTFLSLLWSSGTNTATSVGPTLGYAVSDQTGLTSYTAAATSLHTEEWVLIDLKSTEEIDSFAMFFDPILGMKLSNSAVLKLQANATSNFLSPAVDITLTLNDDYENASHFFSTSQSYRYWRVQIIDPDNSNLYVEIGTIVLGLAKQLTQNPETGFEFSVNDQSKRFENDFGNQYNDLYPVRNRLKFDYKWLSDDDILILEGIFRNVGNSQVITVSIDTTEELFDKERFLIYGKIVGDFREKNSFYNFFDTDLEILEAF